MRKWLLLLALLALGAGEALLFPTAEYSGVLSLHGPGGVLVLRDQKAYDAFIDRIPRTEISKTNPAPPSDDPLLKRPKIDFTENMAVVATSNFPHTRVKIVQLRLQSDGESVHLQVERVTPEEAKYASVPNDVGRYHLVVVDRRNGEVREVNR